MWSIALIGANQKANSDIYSNVALASVQALASYTLITLSATAVRPYSKWEGETTDGVGYSIVETRRQRMTYSIAVENFDFNDSNDTNTYSNLMNVLNMRYLFLKNIDYPKTLTCTNGVVDVVRTGYDTESDDPKYSVTIELSKRKVNP